MPPMVENIKDKHKKLVIMLYIADNFIKVIIKSILRFKKSRVGYF